MNKKVFTAFFLMLALLTFSTISVFSYPGGIAGRTKKTSTQGCGSCHNSGTTITGAITGFDTVVAGQTYTFTLTLTTTGGSGKYGVDIAAKNGTLAIISGQGLKVSGTDLVHSSGITWVSPKAITFSYTAPSIAGTDTLYATVDRGYSGAWNWAPNKGVIVKLATGVVNNETPVNFYISQNFPNPFNPVTQINYGVAKSSNIKISVYNLLGKEVAVLVNGYQNPGNYITTFDASKFSSGIYYYKIQSEYYNEVRKMTLIK